MTSLLSNPFWYMVLVCPFKEDRFAFWLQICHTVTVCWSWNSSTLATSCKELTHWKDSDAGRDWGQEEKGTTEDEMAGWHHWLDGCESQWTPGVGDGQGGLACCDSWGHKESDTTEWRNWTELNSNHEFRSILAKMFSVESQFYQNLASIIGK